MTVLQIAFLVCAVVVLWLSAIGLIVVWVMGMSRNARMDEHTFRRQTGRSADHEEFEASTESDRTSA